MLFWHWQNKISFRLNFTIIRFSSAKQPSKKKNNMSPSIPDRWIPYKACGKVIEGTRFICFKVPLKRSVQSANKGITEIWDIKALLSAIPNLGAVIDLTNTNKYYDPQELRAAGVLHKKILMPGRIIPPPHKVTEFMDACDEFLGKDCDQVVGVHCTHGLNRTGYMVCRYMRDRMGIDAKEAIQRFQIARGYQIERDNYIADIIGTTPPPPHLGSDTTVTPVSEENGGPKMYTGHNWRDECRDNNVGRHSNTPGQYVRHPTYKPGHSRNTNNGGYGNASKTNSRGARSSTDSDRSYDYRYDY